MIASLHQNFDDVQEVEDLWKSQQLMTKGVEPHD
jgi:GntR family transcriptional regulator of gluconate operon